MKQPVSLRLLHNLAQTLSHPMNCIHQSEHDLFNIPQHTNNISSKAELNHTDLVSPLSGFLGRASLRYLVIVVRVKPTPGTLGSGGTDGG